MFSIWRNGSKGHQARCSMHGSHSNRGFTLMEMLIVVAIIAVLVAIAIPVFTSQLANAREATCNANTRSMKAAVATSYMTQPNIDTDAGKLAAARAGAAAMGDANDVSGSGDTYTVKAGGLCPVANDSTYTISFKDGTIEVTCSHKSGTSGEHTGFQGQTPTPGDMALLAEYAKKVFAISGDSGNSCMVKMTNGEANDAALDKYFNTDYFGKYGYIDAYAMTTTPKGTTAMAVILKVSEDDTYIYSDGNDNYSLSKSQYHDLETALNKNTIGSAAVVESLRNTWTKYE